MQKLKKTFKKSTINIINFDKLLKNNFNKINSKQILYKNYSLIKNKNFNIIEFQNIKNINLPLSVLKKNNIVSIQYQYNNKFLFKYNVNYKTHFLFQKIICRFAYKRTNKLLKGRIIQHKNYKHTKLFISILGIIYILKSKNLLLFLHHLVTNKYIPMKYIIDPKKSKPKKYIPNYLKKIQFAKTLIKRYQFRSLFFRIKKLSKKNNTKFIISRRSFIKYLFLQQKIILRKKKLIKQNKIKKLINFKKFIKKNKRTKKLKDFFKKLNLKELKKERQKKKKLELIIKEELRIKQIKQNQEAKILLKEKKRKKNSSKTNNIYYLEKINPNILPAPRAKTLDFSDKKNSIKQVKEELRRDYRRVIKHNKNSKKLVNENNKLFSLPDHYHFRIPNKGKISYTRPFNEQGALVNFAIDFITPPISQSFNKIVNEVYRQNCKKQFLKMRVDFTDYRVHKDKLNKHQRRRYRKKEKLRIMKQRNEKEIINQNSNEKKYS